MRKVEKTYLVACILFEHLGNRYQHSFLDYMKVADVIIKVASNTDSEPSESLDLLSEKDLVDALANPFEILIHEFGNMRLGESSDMILDQEKV